MKKLLFLLVVLSAFNALSQTAGEWVYKSEELKAQYPKDSRVANYLKNALKENPTHEEALHQLAVYHINGNTDINALPHLNKLISLYPNNAEYYWLRAKVNIRKNALKKALLLAKEDLAMAAEYGYEDTARIANAEKYISLFLKNY
jgi:predicted Zn-dependent protease